MWSSNKCILLNQKDFDHLNLYNIQDKCVVVGDRTLCSRLANDGIFLLDTVFQPSTSNLSNQIQTSSNKIIRTLELNLNDASSLLAGLKQIESDLINGLDSLIAQLEAQFNNNNNNNSNNNNRATLLATTTPHLLTASTSSTSATGDVVVANEPATAATANNSDLLENSSWSTVKITDSYFSLLSILSQCLDEIKRINLQSVAIPILSLLLDRLYRLDTTLIEKQLSTNNGSSSTSFG